jgi:DNA-directed RNA polymerase subunit RPC12/RpoP
MVGRTELGKYSCLTCGKQFDTKQSVERHAEVHLGLSHHCIVCDKIFNTRNTLATHYTKQHGGEVASPWAMK